MEKEISVVLDSEHEQLVVSSLQVADDFGKEHKTVLRNIENLAAQNCATKSMFYETAYDNRGKKYPMYIMNRDGFSLLVMGFTGKDALDWKLKYIDAFNKMEKKIKEQSKLQGAKDNTDKLLVAQSKYMNAKARIAAIWLKLGERVPANAEYQQICNAYASEALTGQKVLPMPECHEHYYTATEVGNMLGISANKVGKIATQNNIKTKENGKWFFDKSRSSHKEVETFKYNQRGVDAITAVIEGGLKK